MTAKLKPTKRLRGLIKRYVTDPDSPYVKATENGGLRRKTKQNYKSLLQRISKDYGHKRLKKLDGRDMLRWNAKWKAERGIYTSHALMGMLRGLFSYGMTLLECPQSRRLREILRGQRFEMGTAREQRLTAEMVMAIRLMARCRRRSSVALAQAIQFEGTFRQKDVIGEYDNAAEPLNGGIYSPSYGVWSRGLRWDEIDGNLVLTHITSKKQKPIIIDLRNAPMVMVELKSRYCELDAELTRDKLPTSGPIILNEDTGLPFTAHQYRRLWRGVADECGVPADVRSMDTRAGAISEADEAEVDLDDIREAATHSDTSMTRRYIRNTQAKKIARSMKKRAASRVIVSTETAAAEPQVAPRETAPETVEHAA